MRLHPRSIMALFSVLLISCESKTQTTPTSTEERPTTASDTVQAKEPVVTLKGIPMDANPAAPGLKPHKALVKQLRAALSTKINYKPRTHHFNKDGSPTYVNRLILETSPYLLQHAHNPVNWYPWGNEAFQRAQALDRPVLMSVGYSTCHWCHVMERESFEDVEIARYINQHFIAIKVDREERPDVDDIYMNAVHILHGRGGWPMTVVMTPSRKPFFGGTYFPARDGDRGARKGFLTILKELSSRYLTDKAGVVDQAQQITQKLKQYAKPRQSGRVPTAEAIQKTAESFTQRFDRVWGGFGKRPKFPRPATLDFLLHYHRRTNDPHALRMVTLTLEKMAAGGMHDQVGGGFHRYSVDRRWLVPHFEKMLYDNAQLTMSYLSAWQLTKKKRFAEVAMTTLDYVLREMTSPAGGFYSATDADSPTPEGHREEGWFFTWTPSEIEAVIGADGLATLRRVYGVTDRGNFEGRNIFYLPRPLAQSARMLGKKVSNLSTELRDYNTKLYASRLKRPPPILDDKVLTAWNGLMISAFARAGRVLKKPKYVQAAERAAGFILKSMRDQNGRLLRTWRNGRAKLTAYLDDYAFFIAGLIELYEASGNERWFKSAVALQALQDTFYADKAGAYFTTAGDHEVLLTRQKPSYDGAEPAGNSYAAMNLLRLHSFTSDEKYRRRADGVFSVFAMGLKRGGTSQPAMLSALDMRLDMPLQVVIVSPHDRKPGPLDDALSATYLPNRALARLSTTQLVKQEDQMPLLMGKVAMDGKTTAYVCEEGRCEKPTSDPAVLAQQLAPKKPLFDDRTPPPLSPLNRR
jgi:uncharacterized protein YyaL (SSP411 family)